MLELTMIPESDPVKKSLQTRIAAIYTAIAKISDDPSWFSDPHNLSYLPIPSPLPLTERFELDNLHQNFRYMGRSKFAMLYDRSHTLHPTETQICLYGSSGSGKSHILAALACLFVCQGKQVLCPGLPDSDRLLPSYNASHILFCLLQEDRGQ